jgi:hypothetical protein
MPFAFWHFSAICSVTLHSENDYGKVTDYNVALSIIICLTVTVKNQSRRKKARQQRIIKVNMIIPDMRTVGSFQD